MKKITRILCLAVVFCLLLGTFGLSASASGIKFSDINKDQWFYAPIMKAAEAGIVAGNADGSYDPRGELTWAQTITFAVRLDQYNKGQHIYGSADQVGNNWFDVYISYALDKGIISVSPAAPNSAITRGDAAIIFAAVLGSGEKVNHVPAGYFEDVAAGHPAYEAVYALAEAGICNGKDTALFGLADKFMRSEVAAIVARMAGLVEAAVLLTPDAIEAFDALEGRVFTYTNSQLAGTTTLTMGADGTFTGKYIDSQPLLNSTEYPKGTTYLCNFTGRFKNVTAISGGIYQMEIDSLALSALPDKEVVKDGMRYISTVAYGFENAELFDLFLPGSYTKDMPECLVNALIIANGWGQTAPDRVSETVLHNHSAHKAIVEDIPAGVTAANLFARLEGQTFTYTSGAGAWRTTITFGPDGSFTGEHTNSDMGDTAKEYPKGTVYTSSFWGAFTEVVKEGDCKYSLRLRYLYLDNNRLGEQNIVDGVRYVVTGAVGFEKAGYFTLYLPGMETAKTPEPMVKWLSALEGWGDVSPASIPCWTLYNIGGEAPFITY